MRARSFDKVLREQYRELLKKQTQVPKVVGSLALRHFKRGMQDEGFRDRRLVRWKEVQRRTPGHPRYSPKQQQKILVGKGSGGIQNTLRVTSKTWKAVKVSSVGKKYAAYHNDGAGKLPKRQFLGNSHKLETEVERYIHKAIKKAFK